MKLIRVFLAALAAIFVPSIAIGQVYTSIAAVNLPLTSGQMCLLGTDANDNAIEYKASDGTDFTSGTPICQTITNGSIGTGMQVPNVATATPVPPATVLLYRIYLQNVNVYPLIIRGVNVSGASWDYASFILPANGVALGFGPPTLTCNVGAQYTQTDALGSPAWTCALNGNSAQWQTYPQQGFCPTNSAYVIPKTGQAFCIAYQKEGVGAPKGACTENSFYFQKDAGQAWLWGCQNGVWSQQQSSKGTVVSVGLNSPNPQVDITGSPITDKGTITIALNTTGTGQDLVTATSPGKAGNCSSWTAAGDLGDAGGPCVTFVTEPANTVFAAPDGQDGLPSFRHIVERDLPFTYSGSTSELATVIGSLISGSAVVVGANGNITNATSSSTWPGTIPSPSQVQGLAPSATIDTTNASNITSGTLNPARLPSITWTCPAGQVLEALNLSNPSTPTCVAASGTISIGQKGFLPYYLDAPTGQTLVADTVVKTDGNGNLVANTLQLSSSSATSVLTISPLGGSDAGCLYTDSAGNVISTHNGCGVNGTVTSVGLQSNDTSVFTISNSPVTSSGVINMSLQKQGALSFLAGPDQNPLSGGASPNFRTISLNDLPFGPMPNVPASSDAGSYIMGGPCCYQTVYPWNYLAPEWRHINANDFGPIQTPNLFLASASSTPNVATLPTFRNIVAADLPPIPTSLLPNQVFKSTPTQCTSGQAFLGIDVFGNAVGCYTTAGGSVLSVGLSLPNDVFAVSGSPVTVSGTLAATFNSQSGNTFLAAPNGATGAPAFRALVAADIAAAGTLTNNINGNAATATLAAKSTALAATPTQCTGGALSTGIDAEGNAQCASGGFVSSVGLSMPPIFNVTGSPVITAGTLTAALANENPNLIFAGPATGSTAAAPTFRTMVAADLPASFNAPTASALAAAPSQCAAGTYAQGVDVHGNAICAGAGAVTSVNVSGISGFSSTSGGPITTSGTISQSLVSQSANTFLAAPSGSAGTPSFRAIVNADLPSTISQVAMHALNLAGGCPIPGAFTSDLLSVAACGNYGSYGYQLAGIDFQTTQSFNNTSGNLSVTALNVWNNHQQFSTASSNIQFVAINNQSGPDEDNVAFFSAGALTGQIPVSGGFIAPKTGVLGFQSGSGYQGSLTGSPDTGISRVAANSIAFGNGTAADSSATVSMGPVNLTSINFGSSVGTVGPSGGNLLINLASGVNAQLNGGLTMSGAAILNNTLSVASTANLNATNFGANATLLALNPATSTQNFGSTSLQLKGSIWNGTEPTDTLWTLQNQVAATGNNPSQTLTFTASGSTGTAAISIPGLIIPGASGCLQANSGTIIAIGVACGTGGGGGSGTVTQVIADNTGSASALFTMAVATPTTTPTLSYTVAQAPAHKWFGNSASGSATPGYESLTAADIPILTSANLPADTAYLDVAQSWTATQTMQNLTVSGTLTASGLTGGKCVQTGTGGALSVTSTACQQGTVTSIGISVPNQMTVSGSPVTTSGTIALGLNTSGTGSKVTTASTVGTSGHTVVWTSSGDLGDGGIGGTVGSVGLSLPTSVFTVSGSPVTTTGTLTGTLNSQTSNTFFAAPNGSAGVPAFRTIATSDLPASVNGLVSAQNANLVYSGPTSGSAAGPTFRNLVAGDIPTIFRSTAPTTCATGLMIGIDQSGNARCQNYLFNQTSTGGFSGQTIATGDFNGDGFQDYALCSQSAGSIYVFLNQGGSGFPVLKSTLTATNCNDIVAVSNLASSGKVGLVITQGSTGAEYFVGNGDGTFQSSVTISGLTNASNVASADINGDGIPDIAISDSGANSVLVYKGTSSAFTLSQTISVGTAPEGIVLGKWSSASHFDIAVVNTSAGTVSILTGNGTLTGFSVAQTVTGIGTSQYGGALEQGPLFNGTYNDLVVQCGNSNSACVLKNNQSGSFSLVQTITGLNMVYPSMSWPIHWSIADYNGDGWPDLAVPQVNSNAVNVYLNNTGGTLNLAASMIVGSNPSSARSAVLNISDKYMDIAVVNASTANMSLLFNQFPIIQTNQYPQTYVTVNTPQTVTSQKTFGPLQTFNNGLNITNLGQGDNWQVSASNPNVGNGTFTNPVTTPGSATNPIAYGDLNGDGYMDVVTAVYASGSINVYLNNGNGAFAAPSTLNAGSVCITSVVLADINKDGYLDVVIGVCAGLNNGGGSGGFGYSLGTGTGTFGGFTYYISGGAGNNVTDVAVADINLDSWPDVIMADEYNGFFQICRSNGTAIFSGFTNHCGLNGSTNSPDAGINTGLNVRSIAVVDLSGDGKPDLIGTYGTTGAGGFVTYLNTSTTNSMSFGAQANHTAGSNNYCCVLGVGDLNGDGYPEVVLRDNNNASTSTHLYTFINNGSGGFPSTAAQTISILPISGSSGACGVGGGNEAGGMGTHLAIQDLNGDSYPDVAVTNCNTSSSNSNAFSVLLNNGSGTLGNPTTFGS